MSRQPYDPPVAPVAESSGERGPARWKWLYVPIGHAAWMFVAMVAIGLYLTRTDDESLLDWLFNAHAYWAVAKVALFQGGILLLITTFLLWALPPILNLHAVYLSLASAMSRLIVNIGHCYLLGPMTTNGEKLKSVVVTYVVILVVSSVVIRRSRPRPPNTLLERPGEE